MTDASLVLYVPPRAISEALFIDFCLRRLDCLNPNLATTNYANATALKCSSAGGDEIYCFKSVWSDTFSFVAERIG